jgi:ribosomal protein L37AE/L43A
MTKKMKPLANVDLTSFADLDDGLDSAPLAEARSKEDIKKDAHIANGGEASFPCPRCNGTGQFRGHSRLFPCYKCESTGKVSKGVAAAAKGKVTAAQNKAQRLVEFARDHVEVIDFLVANQEWSEFYRSLHDQLMERGSLSDGQIAAVHRGIEKLAAKRAEKNVEREKKSGTVDISRIVAMFERAVTKRGTKKMSRPILSTAAVTIKPATRHEGVLYVTSTDSDTYLGKIANGRFEARNAASDTTVKELRMICDDPEAAIRSYAVVNGRFENGVLVEAPCGLCHRLMHDEVSLERGIGPVCAARYGLD